MEIPKGMQLVKIKNGVTGEFEESIVPMNAEMVVGEPSEIQDAEDKALLKSPGDSYTRIQKGKIHSGDGETTIECDLTFIRKRNDKGGVDVTCIVPCLATLPEMTMGKP